MIVRILAEGQYDMPSAQLDKLNEMDNSLVNAVAAGNEKEFNKLFTKMLKTVREKGKSLPVEDLAESEVILPAPDTSFEEAKALFVGHGLIPD